MTAKDDEVIIMKVLLLGDIGVGKTTLLSRFAGEGYQEDYPHFETKSRLVSHGNKKIRVVLCDTDGQERFGTLTTALYKGIQGCVLMFSVTEPVCKKILSSLVFPFFFSQYFFLKLIEIIGNV